MNRITTITKNAVLHFLYKYVLKRILFRLDPEHVHDHIISFGKKLGTYSLTRKATRLVFYFEDRTLFQNILGMQFKNPIGLSAGFDKNAELTDILPHVGFGFAEVGSITAKPCEGNPKPRLWRMPAHKSLAVWFGLKNDGAVQISNRLRNKNFKIPIGISIAKTNCKETVNVDAGIADYVEAYQQFSGIGSYDTINISCPNAFGGQPFTDKKSLHKLLAALQQVRNPKPLFIKLSPDLTPIQIDDIIELAYEYGVNGFVCTNLTKPTDRSSIAGAPEHGGFSGKLVDDKSTELIGYIYKKTRNDFVLIGVGGIFNGQDAYKKIRAGASLVQLITGMVYEGPQLIGEINLELVRLLKKDGLTSINEAVGRDFAL